MPGQHRQRGVRRPPRHAHAPVPEPRSARARRPDHLPHAATARTPTRSRRSQIVYPDRRCRSPTRRRTPTITLFACHPEAQRRAADRREGQARAAPQRTGVPATAIEVQAHVSTTDCARHRSVVGIGEQFARQLAERGHDLVLVARDAAASKRSPRRSKRAHGAHRARCSPPTSPTPASSQRSRTAAAIATPDRRAGEQRGLRHVRRVPHARRRHRDPRDQSQRRRARAAHARGRERDGARGVAAASSTSRRSPASSPAR